MKVKLAVPRNTLTLHQIELVERKLGEGLLEAVASNFPNWRSRVDKGDISGGEIILQDTDTTRPIKGVKPGIHLTLSLISFMPGRNFDGLARTVIGLIKQADDQGLYFMDNISIYVQVSLDQPVRQVRSEGFFITGLTDRIYEVSSEGRNLLEYSA